MFWEAKKSRLCNEIILDFVSEMMKLCLSPSKQSSKDVKKWFQSLLSVIEDDVVKPGYHSLFKQL